MATGDQLDIWNRLKGLIPASWFQGSAPNADALTNAAAWALSTNYSQMTYAALQLRIKTATGMWLDIISEDFFGADLPRLVNETDANFRSRILGNLFVKGPARANMVAVLRLITENDPTIFEPSNTTDSGGWDGGFYFDTGIAEGGGWGDPLPYQAFITAYRPSWADVALGELDSYTFMWDVQGAWSDSSPISITDAAIIAAVEATKPVGMTIWLRIANQAVTP